MKFFKYQKDFILVLFLSLLMLIEPLIVKAYIDAGTGSIIIQAVIAFIAVIIFYFKFFWRKIRDFFRYFLNKYKKDKDNVETDLIDEHKQ